MQLLNRLLAFFKPAPPTPLMRLSGSQCWVHVDALKKLGIDPEDADALDDASGLLIWVVRPGDEHKGTEYRTCLMLHAHRSKD